MSPQRKEIVLTALSALACLVVIISVTLTWFVFHNTPDVDHMVFAVEEDINAEFDTWYKPYSEMVDGKVSYDTKYVAATNPLVPEAPQTLAEGAEEEHEYKYLRPGDKFRFHIRVTRTDSKNRDLRLTLNDIRPILLTYDEAGNLVGVTDPYAAEKPDISAMFSVRVVAVAATAGVADANALPTDLLSKVGKLQYLDEAPSDTRSLSLAVDGDMLNWTWAGTMAKSLDVWVELTFLDERTNIVDPVNPGGDKLTRTANGFQDSSLKIGSLHVSAPIIK